MEASRLNNNSKKKKKVQKNRIKKKKPRWLKITLAVILVLLFSTAAYAYHVYNDVANAVKKMNVPLAKGTPKVDFNNLQPISILMLGVDQRPEDNGRSDSILVITVNPKTKTTKLLSIPRDTRTMLINKSDPSKDQMDKINAAYAYGGVQESIDTVENLINVPIDYYIKINMQGFEDLVTAVGGIDVNNKYAFSLDGVTLKTGPQHLNGRQALEYARMRHQDPLGDFGREQRQREVITKIINKGKSISILTKYNAVLQALENNIQTNLTMNDIIGIQSSYKPAAQHIDSFQLTGTNDTINGIYYYKVEQQERQSVSDQLRQSLGLSTAPVAAIYDSASTSQSSSSSQSSTSSSTSYNSSSYTPSYSSSNTYSAPSTSHTSTPSYTSKPSTTSTTNKTSNNSSTTNKTSSNSSTTNKTSSNSSTTNKTSSNSSTANNTSSNSSTTSEQGATSNNTTDSSSNSTKP